MRWVRGVAAAMSLAAVLACGEGSTDPSSHDLAGSWFVPALSSPTFYGFTSAQIGFRTDGTFRMVGKSLLSSSSTGDFEVSGSWTHSDTQLVLITGEVVQFWNYLISGDTASFASLDGSTTFRIHRALPD